MTRVVLSAADWIVLAVTIGTVLALVALAVWMNVFGWPLIGIPIGTWFNYKMTREDERPSKHER